MDFSPIFENFSNYTSGLWITVQLLFFSLLLGMSLSLTVVSMRRSKSRFLTVPAWLFIYFFRGTPLLVQLYIIYFGFGQFVWVQGNFLWPIFKDPFLCGILALSLNNAGYTAEIFYNSICTLNRGEQEACKAFGMNRFQYIRRFLLPSMLRRSLQAYSNEVIFMLHATALVSLLTVLDITGVARKFYADYYIPFEAFITAGFFYLCLTFFISFIFQRIEKKTAIPGSSTGTSRV